MSAAEWFGAAISRPNVRNALATSCIVGPILTAINQGDVVLAGGDPQMLKLALTFVVPYCVATVAGANARVRGNVCDTQAAPDEPEPWDAAADGLERRPGSVGAMAAAEGATTAREHAVPLEHIESAARVTTEIRDNAVQVNQRSKARKSFLEELTTLSQSVADEVAKIEEMAGESRQALNDIRDSVESISGHVDAIASRNEQGTGLVREVDDAVRRFNAEFAEIERMSQQISEIAEKTNLLALNATIEAARAGEAGRGFAVVAQEVKQLATTSGTSAEEIKRLLSSLSGAAGEVADKIAALSKELDQATSDSRSSKDAVAAISERVGEAVGTTDRTAAQASEQLGDFRTVIERLESVQDDTEKAIAGSATNIDLATNVLDNLTAARQSIDPDDTAELSSEGAPHA